MAPVGSSSDWFQRPTQNAITAAVVFHGNNELAAIRLLGQGQSFDEVLSGDTVNSWMQEQSNTFNMES